MVSVLFMRAFLFITILATCCTASISIEVVEGKTDKVIIENKDGSNNDTHFCVSKSERAIIVDQKLKCVSQSEIISTVNATNKIRETDGKCFCITQIFYLVVILREIWSYLYRCFLLVILLPKTRKYKNPKVPCNEIWFQLLVDCPDLGLES